MSNFVVNSIVEIMKDLKERLDYYKFYDWLMENGHEDLLVFEEPEDESMFAADYYDGLEMFLSSDKITDTTTFEEIYEMMFCYENEFVKMFADYCEKIKVI